MRRSSVTSPAKMEEIVEIRQPSRGVSSVTPSAAISQNRLLGALASGFPGKRAGRGGK